MKKIALISLLTVFVLVGCSHTKRIAPGKNEPIMAKKN